MLVGILKIAVLLMLVLVLTGCAREIGDDRLTPLWAIGPFLLFTIGGGSWVAWHRRRELERWDLRVSPLPPGGGSALMILGSLAAAAAIVFVLMVLIAEGVASTQRWLNLVLWCSFSAIAVGLAAFLGRFWAERGYFRGEK